MRTFQLNDLPTQLQTTAIDNAAFTQKLVAKHIIQYDAGGNLLDSELPDSLGRQRRPGKSDLEALKRLGRVYRNTIS